MFIYENRKIYSFENQCAQGFAKGGGAVYPKRWERNAWVEGEGVETFLHPTTKTDFNFHVNYFGWNDIMKMC